jgi:hypothetical protein
MMLAYGVSHGRPITTMMALTASRMRGVETAASAWWTEVEKPKKLMTKV